MAKKGLVEATHTTCDHNDRLYTERCFDILNGLELKFTRCIDCHKITELEAKKFTTN